MSINTEGARNVQGWSTFSPQGFEDYAIRDVHKCLRDTYYKSREITNSSRVISTVIRNRLIARGIHKLRTLSTRIKIRFTF